MDNNKLVSIIKSFLESDCRFSRISRIENCKRFDIENFKYYDLPDKKLDFRNITLPDFFGKESFDTWYKIEIDVPDIEGIYFYLELQTDSLVIINNKEKYYALNPFHKEIPLEEYRGNRIVLNICIWNGYMFPGYHPKESDRVLVTIANRVKNYPLKFDTPYLVKKNNEHYNLYYDVYVLDKLLDVLDKETLLYQTIASKLATNLLDINYDIKNNIINEDKAFKVRNKIKPLLNYKNASLCPTIYSTGSAHLDHMWLWPEDETIRKAARTLSQMIYLMDVDSSFIFAHSQPLQIKLVKDYYPKIYEQLLEKYHKGQFEPNGVGYIEPDCMLSSGEGLIRNLLYGRELTKELFPSYYGDTFYVPDSFGYCFSLPQILVKSNVKYIVTSKLGWNDTNRHPYDLFNWEGLDGTCIKAHMIQGAYEGTLDPSENYKMWKNVRNKDIQDKLFRPIGEGDGGGGTRLEDIELMKRQRNLQNIPKNSWSTISNAMKNIFANKDLVKFNDELYLELHRGTYTTQAKIKYYHRKLDKLLHNIDYLLSYEYINKNLTKKELNNYLDIVKKCWLIFVKNQFHDVLPGSSVEIVNKNAEKEYEIALDNIKRIFNSLVTKGNYYLNLTPYSIDNLLPYSTLKDFHRKTIKAK